LTISTTIFRDFYNKSCTVVINASFYLTNNLFIEELETSRFFTYFYELMMYRKPFTEKKENKLYLTFTEYTLLLHKLNALSV
jgi:hypothetical protein